MEGGSVIATGDPQPVLADRLRAGVSVGEMDVVILFKFFKTMQVRRYIRDMHTCIS